MANKLDNLMPIQEVNSRRTREQHSEDSRKAGIKSGEVRRETKLFKQGIAERMGYESFNEMIDNLIERAKTNDKAFEILRDTLGQRPVEKQEIKQIDTDWFIEE